MKKFKAKIVKPSGGGWVHVRVPFDTEKEFGTGRGVKVNASVNGVKYKTAIFPSSWGYKMLPVKEDVRKEAGVDIGDTVNVTVEKV